jgi:hypothetical protein
MMFLKNVDMSGLSLFDHTAKMVGGEICMHKSHIEQSHKTSSAYLQLSPSR